MQFELFSPLLTTLWGRRTGFFLWVAMSFLFIIIFIFMLFTWYKDIQLIKTSNKPVHIRLQTNDQLNKLIAAIAERHLFGKYSVIQTSILPVTSLQIRLVGVINADSAKLSHVIISESDQSAKIYKVGDTLPSSGVKIYAITTEGVVLNNSGRLEKLTLPRPVLQFQGMPRSLP